MRNLFKSKWTNLFFSNFLGVYNDNLLKNCIIFLGIGWSVPAWMSPSQLISIVSAGLVLPYLIFSPAAGRLAVRHSKLKIFRFFKLIELPIMLIASVAFIYQWILLAIIAVFLMGIQSCLYSPSKYGLIRDIGGEDGVSFGSGIFETMAFLGILIGTVTASFLSDFHNTTVLIACFLGIALLGYWVTRSIRVVELPPIIPVSESLHPVKFLIVSYKFAKEHSGLNSAVFGASSFWFIGGMLQMNLVIHSKNIYHLPNSQVGLIMAGTAIGIAMGCWLAGKISGTEVKTGLVLIGLGGMTIFMTILTFTKLNIYFYSLSVVSVAFMGGFFQIPCLSMLQKANIGRKLGDVIAYLNLVTFIFVLLGTFLFSVTTYLTNENSFAVFGVILAFTIFVFVYFSTKYPSFIQDSIRLLRLNKK